MASLRDSEHNVDFASDRATARARRRARGAAERTRARSRARGAEEGQKGFFEADLVNDLKSVDGDETMSGLLSGDAQAIAGAVGLVANGVTSWSLWVLYNTGCGLPPGPGGSLGALEGVSYLVVTAFVVAATAKKIKTGSGLPAGPGGVLGGAEGISFLVALIGLGVLANQVLHFGYVPNAIPTEGGKCY